MSDAETHVERIRAQFTRQADAYARMAQTVDARSLQWLVKQSGAMEEERALDVACGPGFLTAAVARVCREVIGLDATAALLEIARAGGARNELANVSFQQGDAEAMPFDGGEFDLATCRAAFHHFPRPGNVLGEMRRVVRSGGRILIADILASEDEEQAAYHNRVERLCDPTHVNALGEAEFAGLFREQGVEVMRRKEGAVEYDLEEWMEHGGPNEGNAAEIRQLMEASADEDVSGLDVKRVEGRLRFRHRTVVFVLAVP